MTRIKLKDLSPDLRMSKKELLQIVGGYDFLLPPIPISRGSNSDTNLGQTIKLVEAQIEEVRNKKQGYMILTHHLDQF